MKLSVREICGEDVISRAAGKKFREKILEHWEAPKLEILIGETPNGSASFFDEAIALLIKRDSKTIDELKKKLIFSDISDADRKLLNYVLLARVQESKT